MNPTNTTSEVRANLEESSRRATISINVHECYTGEVFRLKRTTKLKRVFKAFSDRLGLQISLLRFFFAGQPVHEEMTVGDLGMEYSDMINCLRLHWDYLDSETEDSAMTQGTFPALLVEDGTCDEWP